MEKYSLLHAQMIHEGLLRDSDFHRAEPIAEEVILRAHEASYWLRLRDGELSRHEIRRMGFPWSEALVLRERIICQASLDLAGYALKNRSIGLNIAGGTHHASSGQAEGFCLLNDMALTAIELLHQGDAESILIVDLDVHQGNGTAEILQDEERIFTFSMHGAKNFPMDKAISDLDIGLDDGTDDHEFLEKLFGALPQLLDRIQPDIVLYNSGVDVLEADKLGRMAMSMEGVRQRDAFVLNSCFDRQIPMAVAMGGGYSKDVRLILEAHMQVFRMAHHLWG
jgi:acetoin utilization deacetylase AcuC-like enzyme